MARKTTKQSNELQQRAKELHNNGQTNKQIANELQVTEKTVSKWLKPYTKNVTAIQEIQTKLIQRINQALANESTTAKDLFCLFQSLKVCNTTEIA